MIRPKNGLFTSQNYISGAHGSILMRFKYCCSEARIIYMLLTYRYCRCRHDLQHVEALADRGGEINPAAETRRREPVERQWLEEIGLGDDLAGGSVAPG